MPSLFRTASDASWSENRSDEDEDSSDYAGHVLALNGHKKYFCLFKPVFTGDDPSDSSSEASFSSDSRRKSRSRSRSSSHSRSRSHSREDGTSSRRGSTRATSIEVHHKLDRLGLWMERLMEGTLPRFQVPTWPPLYDTTSKESWGQRKKVTPYALASRLNTLARKPQSSCGFHIIILSSPSQMYVATEPLQPVYSMSYLHVEQMEIDDLEKSAQAYTVKLHTHNTDGRCCWQATPFKGVLRLHNANFHIALFVHMFTSTYSKGAALASCGCGVDPCRCALKASKICWWRILLPLITSPHELSFKAC